jgi:hypothetical protein
MRCFKGVIFQPIDQFIFPSRQSPFAAEFFQVGWYQYGLFKDAGLELLFLRVPHAINYSGIVPKVIGASLIVFLSVPW